MRTSTTQKGFTLIEMLVSISLFSIVMMISVGTLLTLVDANRKAQNVSTITTNLHFALDLMSRTIRTGTNYYCGDSIPVSYVSTSNCPYGGRVIAFKDQNGVLTAYIYDGTAGNQKIYRIRDIDLVGTMGYGIFSSGEINAKEEMTATPALVLEDMKFIVTGSERYFPAKSNKDQPSVRILLKAKAGTDPETGATMNIETTIVQRTLDL